MAGFVGRLVRPVGRPVVGHDAVRVVLAAVLLVAAVLKCHQLATSPVLGDGLLDTRWFLIFTVEFELFFGLWLLSGLLPRITWAAALGCFDPVEVRRGIWGLCVRPRSASRYRVRVVSGCPCRCLLLLLVPTILAATCSRACAGETRVVDLENQRDEGSDRLAPGPPDAKLPQLRDNRAGGPYCGINSLYVCLSAVGIETKLEDYVSTKYVGSFQGSSAKELLDAAKDFGVEAECFSHLTYRELQRAQTPMILHMRSSWADGGFNHWVAFLGYDGDRMRIVDAPHPLEVISPAELSANWDGTAIAVSKGTVDRAFLLHARVDYVLGVGLLLLAIYVLRRMFFSSDVLPSGDSFLAPAKVLALHAGVIIGFSFVLGLGYHVFSEVGFLRNPTALAEVIRRYYSIDVPDLSLAETEKEIREGKPMVLDARRSRDYRRGALPRAKSMSLFSTLSERQQVLAGVSKAQRIIVYCQSAGCGYADEVAKFLKFNGYENLAIYRDGYRVWRENHAPPKNDKTQRAAKNTSEDGHVS